MDNLLSVILKISIFFIEERLKYARFNGTSWDIEIIDAASNVGDYNSLAVVNGQPAISYTEVSLIPPFNDTKLKYARFNGTTWDIEIVDAQGNVGFYNSLKEVNGQPAISYWDGTNNDLKFAKFNGTTWDIEIVDAIGGIDCSLTIVAGQPAISYLAGGDLKYARYNGTSWDIQTIDEPATNAIDFQYTSLAVVNGQPAVCYQVNDFFAFPEETLKLARYNGTSWEIETVINDFEVGSFPSLVEVGGQPAISYARPFFGDQLSYARYNGSAWEIQNVPGTGTAIYTSLAVVNGKPAVSYADNSELKYIEFPPPPPIPTLSQWGKFLFGLMIITFGIVGVYNMRGQGLKVKG